MDIALGVSMTPSSVRMVLVEGENADGLTVDHDTFAVTDDDPSATAPQRVLAAILGTRESAAEGGHRLVATGVTWRDHDDAAALRAALADHGIDDVLLVNELHAAGVLAQAVGRTVGYDRTALMFLERDTATMSVVDTADGSVVKVESRDLHSEDVVVELRAMVSVLDGLAEPPQGVFVVGSGVSIADIKLQLESATTLPLSVPDESELALARGAALASALAPKFETATIGLVGSPTALAYSEVIEAPPVPASFAPVSFEAPAPAPTPRKPFVLVGSAMTAIFMAGVAALVVSLAVSIRPTVDERPVPAAPVIAPTPEAAPAPAPVAPKPMPETIPAPKPVVQEAPVAPAPRTVFADAPAPAAPAPAPAAPAPAPAAPAPAPVVVPAPVPEVAPDPIPAPAIDIPVPYIPPPVVFLPKLPILQLPWDPPQRSNSDYPGRWPQTPAAPQYPQAPSVPQYPQQYPQPQQQAPQQPDYHPPSSRKPGRSHNSDDSIWPWPFGD